MFLEWWKEIHIVIFSVAWVGMLCTMWFQCRLSRNVMYHVILLSSESECHVSCYFSVAWVGMSFNGRLRVGMSCTMLLPEPRQTKYGFYSRLTNIIRGYIIRQQRVPKELPKSNSKILKRAITLFLNWLFK